MADGGCFHAHGLYTAGHPMVYFDVPTAAGRQVFSVQCSRGNEEATVVSPLRGSRRDQLAAARSDSGPVIVVFVDSAGKHFTDYASRHINQLMLRVLSSLSRLEEDAQPLQQPDVGDTSTRLEGLSIAATSSSSYKQDTIWVRTEYEWGLNFYTRIDHAGSFHTYPHVGGPFHSLDQVCKAIDRYLSHRLDPKMGIVSQEDNKCTLEMAIWLHLYWPDGTRKRRLETLPIDERRCTMLQLVRPIMDKYNDDHNLSGDLAYDLQRVVRYRFFHDGDSKEIYYHISFTAKTNGFNGFHCGVDHLFFFAELVQRGRDELVANCICRVDPSDGTLEAVNTLSSTQKSGSRTSRGCYACSRDMYHPKAETYSGGLSENCRVRGMFWYDGPEEDRGLTSAELEAEEASLREELDASDFLEKPIEEGC